MSELWSELGLGGLLTLDRLTVLARALIVLVAGLALARLAAMGVERVMGSRFGKQEAMVGKRLVYYVLVMLIVASTLHQLGFQLSVLLGAAGILTVALGFASQTSASNLISGLFLIAERPFVVGDVITVDGVTGEVLSVDLMSVKMRTFDNLFVRVPNESIIKSRITNLTHFPLRRLDMSVGVAYKENLDRVRDVLNRVADANPLCLDEPEPLFIFKGYGDSSLDIQFSVWGKRENYLDLRNSMHLELKVMFDAEGIEIPFPHRTLYTGAVTDPFPVQVATERADSQET